MRLNAVEIAERRLVRGAARACLADSPGVTHDAVAAAWSVDRSFVSQYLSAEPPDLLDVRRALRLGQLCGSRGRQFVDYVLGVAGVEFATVSRPHGPAGGASTVIGAIGKVTREQGELAEEVGTAIEDGTVTPSEASRIGGESLDLERAARDLREAVARAAV